ncbi:MAG TPA: LacI family DNA-binding transcriptional regulator, partial [Spirochaetia bacterium]|nr:LacI family DNA-binding transcriptional regulator [Spirochaetia bacterium]
MIFESTLLDEFLSGIQRRLFKDDYSLLFLPSRGEDPITRIRLQIRKGQGYDGFVLFGTRYCTEEDMKLYINELRTTNIPFVVANMPDLGLPLNQVVLRDPPDAGAIKYLLDLGHRQIFLMAGRPGDAQGGGEIIQYRSTLMKKGVEVDEQLIGYGDYELDIARSELFIRISRGIQFTAIYCLTDMMAMGCYQALREAGLKIPEDVSVIGKNDAFFARSLQPTLTCIGRDLVRAGEIIADILLQMVRNLGYSRKIFLDSELIVRDSTRAITSEL